MIIKHNKYTLEFTKPILTTSSCWECRYSRLDGGITLLVILMMNNNGFLYHDDGLQCKHFKDSTLYSDIINCQYSEDYGVFNTVILRVNFSLIINLGIQI